MGVQIGRLVNSYGIELGKVNQLEVGVYPMYEVEFPSCPIVFHSLEEACRYANLYSYNILLERRFYNDRVCK